MKVPDIAPLSHATKLEALNAGGCTIRDISPLATLTRLNYLHLSNNLIADVSPLMHLLRLETLEIKENRISDVSPLAGLTRLTHLEIHRNRIADHSPLDGLSLAHFTYDEVCEMPRFPLDDRLNNRNYPSVYTFWGDIVNRPDLISDVGYVEKIAMHDLACCDDFGLRFLDIPNGVRLAGQIDYATDRRDARLDLNPNMVSIIEIRMRDAFSGHFPPQSPYWVKDAQGNNVNIADNLYLLDFTHPDVQDIIVERSVAVSRCGLFDGIFIDHWRDTGPSLDGYRTNEAEQRARDNIIKRIRAETSPDFIIMGNTNDRIPPRTGHLLNGTYMENGGSSPRGLEALQWLESNLMPPQLNCLQGNSIVSHSPDSRDNLQRMRAVTTLSLTNSNGYVVFVIGGGDDHYWYDFWDADLGQPVGEKGQLYQDIDGLYIREFTNGWAVYNHSGAAQPITLAEKAQGVASGWVGTQHALPNLDGEMYLRVKPANPADVNGDGVVNIFDLTIVAQAFGTGGAQGDVNGDGAVNVFDLVIVAEAF